MDYNTKTKFETAQKKLPQDKKPYSRPVLRILGDIRSNTLGGSPGTGDSGTPFIFRPRTGP